MPIWIYAILVLVFSLFFALQFHQWLSLVPDAPADSTNPPATSLYVVNEGYLTVFDVWLTCEFSTQTGVMRLGNQTLRVSSLVKRIGFEHRESVPCGSALPIENSPFRGTTFFTITATYRVGELPLHRSQTFRMKAVNLPDGTHRWLDAN